jgi:hypothetical protein
MRYAEVLDKEGCSDVDIYPKLVLVAVATTFTVAFADSIQDGFCGIK